MGGMGSGRYGGRPTTDGCRSLDINRLHREGCLRPGWFGGWHWSRDGERVGTIDMRAIEGRLILSYRYRYNDEEWRAVEEPVLIDRTPCHFGGSRPWFICPGVVNGVSCGRRVGKLYGPARYFLCRHCYRLAYQSQREQPHDRALRRAVAIRRRLGGEPGMLCPFPEKPQGMQLRTYERLRQRAAQAEGAANEHLWIWLAQLKARRGNQRKAKGFWT